MKKEKDYNFENNINGENKDIYENNVCRSIEPYLDALYFFTKIKEISNTFNQTKLNNISNPNLSKFKSINDFIDYFIKNNINENFDDDSQKKIWKNIFKKQST